MLLGALEFCGFLVSLACLFECYCWCLGSIGRNFLGFCFFFDNLLFWVTFRLVDFCGFICCLFVALLHLWDGICGFCVFWLLVLVCAAFVFL